MWRHFFAVGPAFVFVTLSMAILFSSKMHSNTGPISRAELVKHRAEPGPVARFGPMILLAWGEAGAVYFMADAMRRIYRGGPPIAVAFALFGLLSFGMFSFLYYVFWGHRELEPESGVYSDTGMFCDRCLSATTDSAAPSTLAWNLVFGTRYMGSSDRFDQCKSVVRTLWAWVVLPIFPLGTYRVVSTDTYRFIGRKTALRWDHVTTVCGIAVAVVAFGWMVYATHN